jgi:hypothetical protein
MSSETELETEENEPETEVTADGGLSRLSLPGTTDLEDDELVAPRRRDER